MYPHIQLITILLIIKSKLTLQRFLVDIQSFKCLLDKTQDNFITVNKSAILCLIMIKILVFIKITTFTQEESTNLIINQTFALKIHILLLWILNYLKIFSIQIFIKIMVLLLLKIWMSLIKISTMVLKNHLLIRIKHHFIVITEFLKH